MSKNIFYIFTTLVLSLFLSSGASHAQDYMDDYTTTPSHESELDYDGRREPKVSTAWHSFGCQWVDYDEDRIVFHVNGSAGRFKKVRVKVGNNKPYYINVRILTYDGFKKRFHVEADASFPGEAITVQFSDIPRRIKRISLKYDARMRPGDRTKICMSGQKVQKSLSPKSRLVAKAKWKKLGCIQAKKGFKSTRIQVGEDKGRFKDVRLFVHNAPAMIDDLMVTYEDGQKEHLLIHGYVSANRYSRIYRLRKGTNISAIDIISRSRSLFRTSTICFHGLGYPVEKRRYAQKVEPYANIPRSEEELLDDEQYLSKKPSLQKSVPLPKQSDQEGVLVALERQKKAAARQAELKTLAEQQRKIAEKKKAELLVQKRAIARKKLEKEAALRKEKQRELAKQRKESLAKQQAKRDKEAFVKAQEKASKESQNKELLAKQQAKQDEEASGKAEEKVTKDSQDKEALAKQAEEASRKAQEKADKEQHRKEVLAKQQAKRDEEAFRKAQEKADKEQQRKEALAKQQAKRDEEAFRKAQEKADKEQQERERLAAIRKKNEQARAEEKARIENERKAAEHAAEKERQRIESQRLANQLARQKKLEAERLAKAKVEADRLAELKRLAAKRLAERNKIHSKKGDFPKSKISPDKTGWITYGCQFFDSKIETRFIPVGRLQGTFTKIRVNVTGNSLTMKKMYVVYGNGREEPLIRYSSRVKIGSKTSDYTLSHMRRFISEVKIKAQSRDRNNTEKAMVCLEAFR